MFKALLVALLSLTAGACATKPKPTDLVQREQVLIPVVIDGAMFICPVKPQTPTRKALGRPVTDADVATFIFDLSKAHEICAKTVTAVKDEMNKQAQIILKTSPSGLTVTPSQRTTGASANTNAVNVTVVQPDGTRTFTGVTTANH